MGKLPKLVVFDLDGTMGFFEKIEIDEGKPNTNVSLYVRPKLKEGLSLLNDYTSVIASLALSEYIEVALKAADIRNNFAEIYDRFWFRRYTKTFKPIAEKFKIPKDSVSKNIIYVGNDEHIDAPEKDSDIVFIEVDDISGGRSEAIPMTSIAALIKSLDVENGFNSGFNRLKKSNSEHRFLDEPYKTEEYVSYVPKIKLGGNRLPTKRLKYKVSEKDVKMINRDIKMWDMFG